MTKGWKYEPDRHALSSHGINTTAKGRWRKEFQHPARYKKYNDKQVLTRYTFQNKFDLEDLEKLDYAGRDAIELARTSDYSILSNWGYPYIEVRRGKDDDYGKYYEVVLTLPPPFSKSPRRALEIYFEYDLKSYNESLELVRKKMGELKDMSFGEYRKLIYDTYHEHSEVDDYRCLLLQKQGD